MIDETGRSDEGMSGEGNAVRNEGGRTASSPEYEVTLGRRVLTKVLLVCVLLKPL